MRRFFFLLAALNGFVVVALGAFGAHGLESLLSSAMLEVYQTGVLYQMFHVSGLLAVGVLAQDSASIDGSTSPHRPAQALLRLSGYLFLIGIVLFSGSLYVLAISGMRWLGMVTPLGGVCFLLGWALLAWHLLKQESSHD